MAVEREPEGETQTEAESDGPYTRSCPLSCANSRPTTPSTPPHCRRAALPRHASNSFTVDPTCGPSRIRSTPRRFVGRRTDPYTFFPFGGEVRHCLGAAFATYEAKIVLSRVLCRVILRPDPDYAVHVVRRGLALGPSAGFPVIRMAT